MVIKYTHNTYELSFLSTVIKVLFGTYYLLCLLGVKPVFADETTTLITVNNVVPSASSVSINDGDSAIDLTENNTTEVIVRATITDLNGCEDLANVDVVFYRADLSADDEDDDNHHYSSNAVLIAETCEPDDDATAEYEASFDIEYFSDPTDEDSPYAETNWLAQVTPWDEEMGTSDTDTIEVNTLIALNSTDVIDYGALDLNQNTEDVNQLMEIYNTGNSDVDVYVYGYGTIENDGKSMVCELGGVDIENERYSATNDDVFDNGIPLSITPVYSGLTISQRTDVLETTNLYWGIGVPASGAGGDCEGVIMLVAM